MLINNQSNKSIWEVDHVGFGVANGGTHLQNTFYSQSTPTLGTALSIVYPGARPAGYTNATGGTDTNTYTLNALGTFPGSIIKAGGTFVATATAGAVAFTTSFNCVSMTADNTTGTYTIVLDAVCTNDNIIFLTSSLNILSAVWTFSNPNLTFNSVNSGELVSFIVLQV
jgi:hypothetical protein